MTWDRLLASAPIDKKAALAVARSAEQMPKGSPYPRFEIGELPPLVRFRARNGTEDLSGESFGRIRVIGFIGPLGNGRHAKHLWLIRCVCGVYEGRRYETLKKRRDDTMCWDCNHTETLRRKGFIGQEDTPRPRNGETR
jgi:hypothetical protein